MRLWVSLGCSAEEKANPQPVDVNININFSKEPVGCRSDQLSDVCCYKIVTEQVVDSVKNKSFSLIESLALHIFEVVAEYLSSENDVIEIVISKPNHPVPLVHQPIMFRYCRRLTKRSLLV